jgi:hypothetical protein
MKTFSVFFLAFIIANPLFTAFAQSDEANELAQIRANNKKERVANNAHVAQGATLEILQRNARSFIGRGGYRLQGSLFANYEEGKDSWQVVRDYQPWTSEYAVGHFRLTNGYLCESRSASQIKTCWAVSCSKPDAKDIGQKFSCEHRMP